jgi:hypothetical protein
MTADASRVDKAPEWRLLRRRNRPPSAGNTTTEVIVVGVLSLFLWAGCATMKPPVEPIPPTPPAAQYEGLPADKQVKLELDPQGHATRLMQAKFRCPGGIAPVDMDGDGAEDYGMAACRAGDKRALVFYGPGDAENWGNVLFYVVIDQAGNVLEWAGNPEITPVDPGIQA